MVASRFGKAVFAKCTFALIGSSVLGYLGWLVFGGKLNSGVIGGIVAVLYIETTIALLRRILCIHCGASLCGDSLANINLNPKVCPRCASRIMGYTCKRRGQAEA